MSLALAFSWGVYGFFRKTLPIGPSQGFLARSAAAAACRRSAYIVLSWNRERAGPFRRTGLGRYGAADRLRAGHRGAADALMPIGAKLLRLSTIGIMQYIAPTMMFLIAVFMFHEPFDSAGRSPLP